MKLFLLLSVIMLVGIAHGEPFHKNDYRPQLAEYKGCGGEFNSDRGTIRFPLGGGNYASSADCVWIIRATDPIRITFTSFNLEANFDVLLIHDGESNGSTLLERLSGNSIPSPVETTTNAAYLHFTSDSSSVRTGFQLSWEPSRIRGVDGRAMAERWQSNNRWTNTGSRVRALQGTQCPPRFELIEGCCYHFSKEETTRPKALEACQHIGENLNIDASLAELGNPACGDDVKLMQMVALKKKDFWFGATRDTAGTWTWPKTSGTFQLNNNMWMYDQPNGGNISNCLLGIYLEKYHGRVYFGNWECNRTLTYACQQF